MRDFFGTSILVLLFATWITHVVVCIKTGAWGFLIAGAILFPIANLHGLMIWIGALS